MGGIKEEVSAATEVKLKITEGKGNVTLVRLGAIFKYYLEVFCVRRNTADII